MVFDAVALLLSEAGAALLARGCDGPRLRRRRLRPLQVHRLQRGRVRLLEKAGVALDEGIVALNGKSDVEAFVDALGALRIWGREPTVKMA